MLCARLPTMMSESKKIYVNSKCEVLMSSYDQQMILGPCKFWSPGAAAFLWAQVVDTLRPRALTTQLGGQEMEALIIWHFEVGVITLE